MNEISVDNQILQIITNDLEDFSKEVSKGIFNNKVFDIIVTFTPSTNSINFTIKHKAYNRYYSHAYPLTCDKFDEIYDSIKIVFKSNLQIIINTWLDNLQKEYDEY